MKVLSKLLYTLLFGGMVMYIPMVEGAEKKCGVEFETPTKKFEFWGTVGSCLVGFATYNFKIGYKIYHNGEVVKEFTYIEEAWCVDRTADVDKALNDWASSKRKELRERFSKEEEKCQSNN